MKIRLLSTRTALLALVALAMPLAASLGRAEPPVAEPVPLLLVYVTYQADNAVPRIALGLEKPALKIAAFEKYAKLSPDDTGWAGLAVQLKPDDAKTLIAAVKEMARYGSNEQPRLLLCFTTPDNKVLDCMEYSQAEANILKAGVLDFTPTPDKSILAYLNDQLHPK